MALTDKNQITWSDGLGIQKWFKFRNNRFEDKVEYKEFFTRTALDIHLFPELYYKRDKSTKDNLFKFFLRLYSQSQILNEECGQKIFDSVLIRLFDSQSKDSLLIAKLTIWVLKEDVRRFREHLIGEHFFDNLNDIRLQYFFHHYNKALFHLYRHTGNQPFNPLSSIMGRVNSPLHKSFKCGDVRHLAVLLNNGMIVDFDQGPEYCDSLLICYKGRIEGAEVPRTRSHQELDSDCLCQCLRKLKKRFRRYHKKSALDVLCKCLRDLGKSFRKRTDDNSNVYKPSEECHEVGGNKKVQLDCEKACRRVITRFESVSLEDMVCEFEENNRRYKLTLTPLQRRVYLTWQILYAFANNISPDDTMLKCLQLIWRAIPDNYVCPFELNYAIPEIRYSTLKDDLALSREAYIKSGILGWDDVIKPRNLKHLCRCQVRNCLITNFQLPLGVGQLGLPHYIKSYLLLES